MSEDYEVEIREIPTKGIEGALNKITGNWYWTVSEGFMTIDSGITYTEALANSKALDAIERYEFSESGKRYSYKIKAGREE